MPCLTLTTASIRPYSRNSWGYRPYYISVDVPAAELAFDYGGRRVAHGESARELTLFKDGELVTATRNAAAERRALNALSELGFDDQLQAGAKHFAVGEEHKRYFNLGPITPNFDAKGEFADRWVEFVARGVPQMRAEGWTVEISKGFPFNAVLADDEWYAEIGRGSGIDWFGLELGVTVEGTRHNLLPILIDILKYYGNVDALASGDKGSYVLVPLPAGRQLALPRSARSPAASDRA